MGLFFGFESDSSGVVKDLSKISDKARETTNKVSSDFDKMNSIISKDTEIAANAAKLAFDRLSRAVSGSGVSAENLKAGIEDTRESLERLQQIAKNLSIAGASSEDLAPMKAYISSLETSLGHLELKLSLINASTEDFMDMLGSTEAYPH